MAEILDTYGVPEFFTSHAAAIEDAGDGMIRIIYGVSRNGHAATGMLQRDAGPLHFATLSRG